MKEESGSATTQNSGLTANNIFVYPPFNDFCHETTGKKPERDKAINLGVSLLANGRPVDELTIAEMMNSRWKRTAAKQAIRFLARKFSHQVQIQNHGGMTVLVPRCSA